MEEQDTNTLGVDEIAINAVTDAVRNHMQNNIALIRFLKRDGSVREVHATTCSRYIPEENMPKGSGNAVATDQIRFYSIQDKGWRSCNKNSIIHAEAFASYVIVWRENCSYCERAKDLLATKKIVAIPLQIGVDISREDVLKDYPTATTLPVIVDAYTREYIGGYTELAAILGE